ncbi:hypothetical protein Ddc_07593 [Ditylenchus destructor]|nr:hypothetical protein Ddc_07593 [Ditylenchus destructor]
MFIAAGDREQLSCAEAIDDVGSAQATLLCDSQICVCALSDPHTIWTAWRRRSGAGDVWGAMIWKTTADFQDARRRLAQGCDSLRRAIMRTTTQRLPAVAEPRRAFR